LQSLNVRGTVRLVNGAARDAWGLIADMLWSEESHRRFQDACAELQLSPPMLKALFSLEPDAPLPMGALAELLQCDASWVTTLVDGLEQRGYAERRVYPKDRRVKTLALTAEGEAAKKQAIDRLHEPPQTFGRLSTTEARQLRDLLRKALLPPTDTV
jgi:DNA-binding MarR family transcriptional regulator